MGTTIAIPELLLNEHQLSTDILRHPMLTNQRLRGMEREMSGLYIVQDILRMYLLHAELCMGTQFVCSFSEACVMV
jgi:hypothetical protein